MLFRFRNGRNITGIFLISLISTLMMIVSRSYKQKKGTFIFLRTGRSYTPDQMEGGREVSFRSDFLKNCFTLRFWQSSICLIMLDKND